MKLEVKVLGMPEFERAAREIPELLTKALPAAVLHGVRPFYAAAYANVPKKPTGDLAKAMTIVMAESDEAAVGGFLGALSGPRTKATAGIGFDKKGWYWRLVEFGHAIAPRGKRLKRATKKLSKAAKSAAGIKFVRAHPFLRPSFDQGKDKATDEVADELRAALERYRPK